MQNILIFKAHKDSPTDKTPDYRMSVKDESNDSLMEIGGCWLKEGKKGNKYFSCRLSAPYKARKGWKLVSVESQEVAESGNSEKVPF